MIYAWKPFKLSSCKAAYLKRPRETRYERTNLSSSMLERMTRLKARPGNRFACSPDPKSMFVPLSPGWLQPLSRYFAHNARPTRSPKYSLFISHGGCPPCPSDTSTDAISRAFTVAPWQMAPWRVWRRWRIVEQVNGKIRSGMICRLSPGSQTPPGGDQIILLCRMAPTLDIPLNQPTKIWFLKHTLLDRLTIDSPRITLPFLQANVPTDEVQDVGAGPEGQIHPLA